MKQLFVIAYIGFLLVAFNGEFVLAGIPLHRFIVEKGNKQESIHLFNGQNLEGWYTFLKDRGRNNDPNSVFTVQDGMICISGKEFGCITTNREFENYKLMVEFKWGGPTHTPREDKARDSGILLHSIGLDGGSSGIWMHSIECQIIEGGTGDFIVVGDGTKQFALTSSVASEKQSGSYVFQPYGKPVAIFEGRIQIQSEGAEILFRRIDLIPLKNKE